VIPELNEAPVRCQVEDVWNKGQIELADELLTPDHARRDPILEQDVVVITQDGDLMK
jgi:hypothetical protein|tara:strand:+ start:224 stop:394 length:171 start_codon:yes stop_codon:yes gene_type:complete